MKSKKISLIIILALIASVGIFFMCGRNEKTAPVKPTAQEDFRSTPTTLASIDAAKYLARQFIRDNSVEGMEFRLEDRGAVKNWISFSVVPLNVETDTATIYLSNENGDWAVRGFGTVPPFETSDYPKGF
jgi:hypothetical protein